MASIASFSGLASGIQWQDMVDRIMQLETARRVTPLTTRVSSQEARLDAWNKFNTLATKVKTTAAALKDGTAFRIFDATVSAGASGRALASATASSSASAGSYKLEVIELARAQKVSANAVTDATAARGLGGQIFVNGRGIDIAGGDSLSAIRDKINSANTGANATGVSATIISSSSTSHSLVLTANNTGSRGIELVDSISSGGVLETLGVITGSRSANTAPGSGTTDSQRFADTTTPLASLLGVSSPPAMTTIDVNGQKVSVDLSTDTIFTLMNKMTAAGANASTADEQVGARTMKRLSVQGTVQADAAAADPSASQRVIDLLGFEKAGSTNQISAGTDAKFRLDGFTMTRRTNTVTDALTGVTLNLLASDAALRTSKITGTTALSIVNDPRTIDPGTYSIDVETTTADTRDATTSTTELGVVSYTGVADGTYTVSLTTSTDRSTSASTPSLSVDSAPPTVAAGTYGVDLSINRTASASTTNLQATAAGTGIAAGTYNVGVTFARSASGSNGNLTVNAAPSSVAAGTYAVNVTALATNANTTGTKTVTSYSGAAGGGDKINITDSAGTMVQVKLRNGDNTASIVADMNTAFTTAGMAMQAVNVAGKIQLKATDAAGSSSTFTVTSSTNNVAANLGIANATYNGTNIQGTIGGLAATGSGSRLSGSGALAGLQVTYSGSTTGAVGNAIITDAVTGGTVGGQAATWNSATQTLTTAAGFAVSYTGPMTANNLGASSTTNAGSVTLTDTIVGGTLGGQAATWNAATGTLSNADGLVVGFSGSTPTGVLGSVNSANVGSVSINDTEVIAGGTIDGEAATWDAATSTLTANAGTTAAGLSVTYSGATTSGPVGDVTITTTVGAPTTTVTIDGLAAEWDAATNTIRGAAGSRFQGLELHHTGPLADGHVGNLVIEGTTTAVDLDITRDIDASIEKVKDFATAYSELRAFANAQRTSQGPLAMNGTLRAAMNSVTGALLSEVGGVAGAFTRTAQVGVALNRSGKLDVDGGKLRSLMEGSANDVESFFSEFGRKMYDTAHAIDRAGDGMVATQLDSLNMSIGRLNTRIGLAESRVDVRRQTLVRQFSAMEEALSGIQSQGNFLMSQLAGR